MAQIVKELSLLQNAHASSMIYSEDYSTVREKSPISQAM